jgi:hypothetical protein
MPRDQTGFVANGSASTKTRQRGSRSFGLEVEMKNPTQRKPTNQSDSDNFRQFPRNFRGKRLLPLNRHPHLSSPNLSLHPNKQDVFPQNANTAIAHTLQLQEI